MSGNIIIDSFAVGPLQCNCTIIGDKTTKAAVVVDPGGSLNIILKKLKSMGMESISLILVTHGHFDHFMVATELSEAFSCQVEVHGADLFLWKRASQQCEDFGLPKLEKEPMIPKTTITHGQLLNLSPSIDVKVFHTPGHTPGSCCFHFPVVKTLCAGDTLFRGSVGRTSWEGIPSLEGTSDSNALINSIQTHLMALDPDTKVVTGHGPPTTIGYEKKNNMFVSGKGYDY